LLYDNEIYLLKVSFVKISNSTAGIKVFETQNPVTIWKIGSGDMAATGVVMFVQRLDFAFRNHT
jgi:hypothetical protein